MRTKSNGKNDRALDRQIEGQGDEGDADHSHRSMLSRPCGFGKFPKDNRRGTDFDDTVEAETGERNRARLNCCERENDNTDDVPQESDRFELATSPEEEKILVASRTAAHRSKTETRTVIATSEVRYSAADPRPSFTTSPRN